MDCSTCKAFEASENMDEILEGECHRYAPKETNKYGIGIFPIVQFPEWCMEYIPNYGNM